MPFMKVSMKELPFAIQKCLMSLFSENVLSYSCQSQKCIVVIQEYIEALWSGIAYSINPRNGSFEIVIESFPDVGEKLFSSVIPIT